VTETVMAVTRIIKKYDCSEFFYETENRYIGFINPCYQCRPINPRSEEDKVSRYIKFSQFFMKFLF